MFEAYLWKKCSSIHYYQDGEVGLLDLVDTSHVLGYKCSIVTRYMYFESLFKKPRNKPNSAYIRLFTIE